MVYLCGWFLDVDAVGVWCICVGGDEMSYSPGMAMYGLTAIKISLTYVYIRLWGTGVTMLPPYVEMRMGIKRNQSAPHHSVHFILLRPYVRRVRKGRGRGQKESGRNPFRSDNMQGKE